MADDGTFCTTAEVLRKAGLGASATSSDEAYTNQFVKEVEGYIMGLTRYDFKTNYATITTIAKEILREATSNMAAIYVIQYDNANYNSTREQENIINICWQRFIQCIKLLNEQNTVNFIKT